MSLKFSANLSMLFTDVPFLDRFERAAAAGFEGVEFLWPVGEELDAVVARSEAAGVEVVHFNFFAGDMPGGDRGLLSDPDREHEFRANVPVALELAARLGTPRLNALVGLELTGHTRESQLELAAANVAAAARAAAEQNVEILIEAVNTIHNGPYLLSTTAQALEFIDRVAEPNVKLQYDVFHMQLMEGDLTSTIRRHAARIGHLQIADAPDRHEPGSGEIDYGWIFGVLEEVPYRGWVGLEYVPAAGGEGTEQGFAWFAEHGLELGASRV